MFYYILLQAAPQIVQKDLPLPLPLPEWLLVLLLVVSFLVHILFINLMVGGSVLALFYQILGLRKPDYDKLAYSVAETITVNKSLAIVMGIAPLLVINTLYTTYFYTANALTGLMWIMVIPLVTIALLLLYAHKFYGNGYNITSCFISVFWLRPCYFFFLYRSFFLPMSIS